MSIKKIYFLHNSTKNKQNHNKNHNKTLTKTKAYMLIFVDIEDSVRYNCSIWIKKGDCGDV